jgi:hypothetical protein
MRISVRKLSRILDQVVNQNKILSPNPAGARLSGKQAHYPHRENNIDIVKMGCYSDLVIV